MIAVLSVFFATDPPRYAVSVSRRSQSSRGCFSISLMSLFWAINSPAACGVVACAADSSNIYVARRGWHVDIGLSTDDLAAPLDTIAADLPGAHYVFFGFADKHYLLAKHHNPPVLLRALWPGDGIMLVTGLALAPGEAFGEKHVISLGLDAEEMHALQSFIWKTLRTQGDSVNVYQTGPYEGSVYYLAAPKYSAVHTCNTWAAEALRAAGFHVHTAGIVFAGQLWSQASRLKRMQERELPCSQEDSAGLKCKAVLSRPDTRRLWCSMAAQPP
jgi:hypothetical protein